MITINGEFTDGVILEDGSPVFGSITEAGDLVPDAGSGGDLIVPDFMCDIKLEIPRIVTGTTPDPGSNTDPGSTDTDPTHPQGAVLANPLKSS